MAPLGPSDRAELARCYSIEDIAEVAGWRLPLASRAYLDTGAMRHQGVDKY